MLLLATAEYRAGVSVEMSHSSQLDKTKYDMMTFTIIYQVRVIRRSVPSSKYEDLI